MPEATTAVTPLASSILEMPAKLHYYVVALAAAGLDFVLVDLPGLDKIILHAGIQ